MTGVQTCALPISRAIEPLVTLLSEIERNWVISCLAAEALRKIGSPAVESLIVALKNPDETTRFAAAMTMRNINDQRIIEPLIVAVQDSSAKVRYVAAQSLGYNDDVRVIPALEAALNDDNETVRRYAQEALDLIKKEAIK